MSKRSGSSYNIENIWVCEKRLNDIRMFDIIENQK